MFRVILLLSRGYQQSILSAIYLERFSLDCRIAIGFGFGFGFTTSFGWLVYLLWFWVYDSQVKTALSSQNDDLDRSPGSRLKDRFGYFTQP